MFRTVYNVFVPTLQRRRELDAELERSQADRKTLLARLQVLLEPLLMFDLPVELSTLDCCGDA
jgi:hypothetical protein